MTMQLLFMTMQLFSFICTRHQLIICMIFVTMTSASSAQLPEAGGRPPRLVCRWDRATQESTTLFALPDLHDVRSLCASRDGQKLAFDAASQNAGQSERTIYVCNVDGTRMKPLGRGVMPTWSPRGKRLAFSKSPPDGGVWLMRMDGSHQQIIDYSGWGARWSPDGNMIAYTRHQNGRAAFVIYNMVEDRYSLLWPDAETPYRQLKARFSWSPDSERLIFAGQTHDNTQHIASVSVTDSNDREIWLQDAQVPVHANLTCLDSQTIMLGIPTGSATQLHLLTATGAVAPAPGPPASRSNDSATSTGNGAFVIYISRDSSADSR